jgi:hypothetical protein
VIPILGLVAAGSPSCAHNPAPVPTPTSSLNRPPFVRITCHPCSVQSGTSLQLVAEASDPDGDGVEYSWRAAKGSFVGGAAAAVTWSPPAEPGSFPLTVTVTDGRGGAASDSITVVVRPR